MIHETARVHETANIEKGVHIGAGSSVWHHVHIRHDARLGEQCLVGGKSLIAYEVQIGNRVKINSNVYICYGVTIEDGVMISAGTIFTNDRFPRACNPELTELRSSDPDEETYPTLVRQGATIGAGAIVGSDLTIGQFAMVGMGSIITRDVPDFHLVIGSPARSIGFVCRCGHLVRKFAEMEGGDSSTIYHCPKCERAYRSDSDHNITEA